MVRWAGGRAGAWALGCAVAAIVIIMMTPRPVTPAGVTIDYHSDLARFDEAAPYTVLAPAGLPSGWQPVSSRLTVTHGGPVSWHLGFITPSGRMASLEESNEPPGPFILRMTNNGNILPWVRSGDARWARRWRADKDQHSMYRSAPGALTIVVTGTSGWDELSTLAGSLRPQGLKKPAAS